MMSLDDAVQRLRHDPEMAQLVHDAYLDEDTQGAADRFEHSSEWNEVTSLVGAWITGGRVLDLGAGTGIATVAFVAAGATKVYAVEPDPSFVVGRGVLCRLTAGLPVEILDGVGEALPLEDGCVDLVYTRQVLHHTSDLAAVGRESARVLRPGGVLLATREHVVDDAGQLHEFLANHPIHQLAGGEHAYPLDAYLTALRGAGLIVQRVIGPWDNVINAWPAVRAQEELSSYPRNVLADRIPVIGPAIARVPLARTLVWKRITKPRAGRMYSFLAQKPD